MAGQAGRLSGTVAALAIGLIAATPASAERFAIACKGQRNTILDLNLVSSHSMNTTYIIDDEARTVDRYMGRGRPLAPACSLGVACKAEFSAARIVVNGATGTEANGRTDSFDWDRTTGELNVIIGSGDGQGSTVTIHEKLKCAPAPIPRA